MKRALALGMIALGVVALICSQIFATSPQGEPVRGNFPINRSALKPGDISAHNSPAIVQNPRDPENVVVANRIDSPGFSCAVHVSSNGADSFSSPKVPLPPGEKGPCFAADVSFGGDGTLYLSYVTLTGLANAPEALWVTSSTDGGRTFAEPVQVAGELSFQARIAADPHTAGRVYATWLQAEEIALLAFPEAGYPIVSAYSEDAGRTWSAPTVVSEADRQRVIAPAPTVEEDGDLLVAYLDVGDDRLDYNGGHGGTGGPPYPGTWSLVLARSSDGGESWSETVVEESVVPAERFVVFFPPFPSVATDPSSDDVFVAFSQAPFGDPDAFLWRSEDGGDSFTDPVRVNDTIDRDGTTQELPKVAVAPDGRVDVIYYDRRADEADIENDVSLQSSYTGGSSFGPSQILNEEPFDSRIGFGGEQDLADLGSRLGLLSTDEQAVGVWTDTRGGTEASHKQDLVRAVVLFDEKPLDPAGSFRLRIAGIALILVGLVLLTSWSDRAESTGGRRS